MRDSLQFILILLAVGIVGMLQVNTLQNNMVTIIENQNTIIQGLK